MLARADVLVAIWDGQGAQGLGGTGGIVAEARERGLPLAWVHAGNRRPGTAEATSLGDEQGEVTFERFPRRSRTHGVSAPVALDWRPRVLATYRGSFVAKPMSLADSTRS